MPASRSLCIATAGKVDSSGTGKPSTQRAASASSGFGQDPAGVIPP